MIFKCFMCGKYKFWNENRHYRIKAVNGDQEISELKACESCMQPVEEKYNHGRKIAELEIGREEPDE